MDIENKTFIGRHIIAKNLRRFRGEAGMSQEQLALESGLNRSYLGSVERATRNISVDNIERLSWALNKEIYEILK